MMIFLVLKERLKSFYGKYATPVNGVIKFIYSFVAMALLNGNIGYQTELTGPVAMAVVALFSAFLPYGAIGCILGAVMLAHIYAVSMETALITAVILIILIRVLTPKKPATEETSAPVITTETAETTAPETEPESTASGSSYKTTTTLNVRKEPSTDADRIGKLDPGASVEYLRDHDDTWAVIKYNGQEAYVAKEFLTAE